VRPTQKLGQFLPRERGVISILILYASLFDTALAAPADFAPQSHCVARRTGTSLDGFR
jgi:hypothetical protein